ncbi:MAG: ComF family protein [Ruminococcaceae bacterium]|nr:ComF family protein [Oscillospiraceae bacterium]
MITNLKCNIMKIKEFIKNFLIIFYPQRCPGCEKVIHKEELFCSECMEEYKGINYKNYAQGGYTCVSAVAYKGVFARAILKFKFSGRKQYSRQLATLMAEAVKKNYSDIDFDFITFVPLHQKRFKSRGYNQSELLAKELSALLNIPIVNSLKKTRNNLPQHELKASKRRENVKGAYRVTDKILVADKVILLIDDIITTGSTLGECAKTLVSANAREIYCAAFAISVVKTT